MGHGTAKLVAKLDGDALGVAVFDGDAVAVGADLCRKRGDVVAIEMAEELERLGFHLLFFAADVGDDVAEDVHRRYAGIARAGDGLHGGDKDLLDAEALFEGLEGQNESDGGAVGIGDHVAARLAARGLLLDQVQVVGVDLGNDQGHIGGHAIGAGVGDDGAAGVGEFRFHFAGDGGVERGENDLRGAFGLGGRDGHTRDAVGKRSVEAPLGGFAVGLAAGTVAGCQPGDLKPGMVFEQLNEALAHHSGRAEDANWIFVLHDE